MTVGELELNLQEILARIRAGERIVIEGELAAGLLPRHPLAALAEALPGVRLPTKRLRDIHFERVPVVPGKNVVEVLREIRDDRDFLR